MLARIVYYRPNSIPEEEIVVVNSFEKAVEIAKRKLKVVRAVSFEIELI
ncbi:MULTISPECIES: hypothetical protein [unclassified Thermococcus]|nr:MULTISPECIES: hypothetical protein [unclassified Thermococcus]